MANHNLLLSEWAKPVAMFIYLKMYNSNVPKLDSTKLKTCCKKHTKYEFSIIIEADVVVFL